MTLVDRLNGWRMVTGGVMAGLVVVFVLGFTEVGQSSAAQFLAQFRSERFAVVAIDPAEGRTGLGELHRLGTVEGGPLGKDPEPVATIDEASQRVGFAVKQPDPASLPDGVEQAPAVRVMPASELRFTFDKDRAQAYFDAAGHPEVSLPDRFDGASLVVNVPAGVLLAYPSQDPGMGLVIGQASAITAGVEGEVSLEELREFLLGLPGLHPSTVRQLREIDDWRHTLPVPVPVDELHWQQTTIGGGEALLLADSSGLGSAAVWQRDGMIYAVAGPLRADEIRRVADGVH